MVTDDDLKKLAILSAKFLLDANKHGHSMATVEIDPVKLFDIPRNQDDGAGRTLIAIAGGPSNATLRTAIQMVVQRSHGESDIDKRATNGVTTSCTSDSPIDEAARIMVAHTNKAFEEMASKGLDPVTGVQAVVQMSMRHYADLIGDDEEAIMKIRKFIDDWNGDLLNASVSQTH